MDDVDGFEVERVRHGEGEGAFGNGNGKDAGLAQEARREAFDFGTGGWRAELRDGQAELLGEDVEKVALGEVAHVDEDLAELFAFTLAL